MTKLINRTDLSFLSIGTNTKDRCFIEIHFEDKTSLFGFLKPCYYDVAEFEGSFISSRESSEWNYEGVGTAEDLLELEWLFSLCEEITEEFLYEDELRTLLIRFIQDQDEPNGPICAITDKDIADNLAEGLSVYGSKLKLLASLEEWYQVTMRVAV